MRTLPRPRNLLLIGLLSGQLLAACQGGPDATPNVEGTPYTEPESTYVPPEIGFFLAQFDLSLRQWSRLKNDTTSQADVRTLHVLENDMKKRALQRRDDLVRALESGPPKNREVAAVALGFTGEAEALSPLLAALSDSSPNVVQKALLGLGILASADTPPAQLTYVLATAPDPWTRNNAAYALLRVVSAGVTDSELELDCRSALFDSEPGVRAQVASILGILHASDSIASLGNLLDDEVPLVARAAITALARIGRADIEHKGEVARLLVEQLEDARRKRKRFLLRELAVLKQQDLGDELEPWREWAYRLP